MGWYQALYEGNGRGEGPSGPRPEGLRLLAHIVRWHGCSGSAACLWRPSPPR